MADVTPIPETDPAAEPASLAAHRARKIEPVELAALTARVEAAEVQLTSLRAALATHEQRNLRIGQALLDAADATRIAREELEREIAARYAAQAALEAERAGREAAERALHAERAAREAARAALVADQGRTTVLEPRVAIPAPPGGFPAVAGPAPVAVDASETDALLAGLARAAERLRAQTPVDAVGAAVAPAPAPPQPVAPPTAAAPAAPAPVQQWQAVPAPPRRSGGLIGALERLLRGRP